MSILNMVVQGNGGTQPIYDTLNVSSSGTFTPATGHAYNSVVVPSGSATPASSISGTSATVSTGTNTLTLTKTVSNTPQVSAGYISSGTSGNTNVSLTASVNTRSSSDLTVSGATVTAPSGYYASQATKTVASGTAGTPTATKGAVSNHSVSVTPSVTNTTGYITGSTKTGTAVSVSASELVSGTKSITENGTAIDVTNYASVDVAVGEQYTATISGTGSNNCCAAYPSSDGTKYYTDGDTFVIEEGETIYIRSRGSQGGGDIYVDNVKVATSDYDTATYSYIVPANTNVEISISHGAFAEVYLTSVGGGGSSKNVQVLQSTSRASSSSLTKVLGDMTVAKTGTYDIYWSGGRTSTSTSYTWGTMLYVDGSGYGTENTTWSNNCQSNHLTGVSLTANQKLSVYTRGRSGSYYTFAPMLVIIEN